MLSSCSAYASSASGRLPHPDNQLAGLNGLPQMTLRMLGDMHDQPNRSRRKPGAAHLPDFFKLSRLHSLYVSFQLKLAFAQLR